VRLLLDTHTLLWAWTEPERLGRRARAHLTARTAEVWVSAASAWEVAAKHRLGRLPEAESVLSGWSANVTRLKARELAMTSSHALLAGGLAWAHRDPFDRMLAAQALAESLVLVTRDPDFADAKGVTTLW
jgi:PIN domain nuclease of toxin-antitoxin system